MTSDKTIPSETPFTAEQFAHLGGGSVAYLRKLSGADVKRLFPQAPPMDPGAQIYALLAADGTPIILTDSKDAAIANAWEHELQPVWTH